MDFIIAKAIYEDEEVTRDMGFVNTQISMDLEVGTDNNFSIKFNADNIPDINYGDYIFSLGTEFGGVFGEREILTESNIHTWKGDTFRGFLKKSILEPNTGEDYLTVSGDANEIIRVLLARQQLDLIYKAKEVTSINIPTFTFRYENLLDGISRMLATVNYKLKIYSERDDYLGLIVRLQAVPTTDFSTTLEYSNDNRIQLRITDKRDGITRLICLGGGELSARTVVHLGMVNGIVVVVSKIIGSLERVAIFDYANAETEEDLILKGTERFLDLTGYKSLEVTEINTTLNMDIGDIIGARDWNTGIYFTRPIISKNVVISGASTTINYKVKGE